MIKITTSSPEETKNIGYRLGKLLKGGEIICMNGDLGAGKTTLTQSIAEGLEVNDYVTSPTFTIVNEYEGRHKLYHFDVYRIGEIDEMYDLGYEEYFYSDGVTIIEWSSMIEEILPKERLNIEIRKGYSSDNRELIINSFGERYDEIIKELKS
ncbi:tRNA threonylcarbamoyladenosine biosynthesis protein TsaE [Gottschalkia purinilytica]|uniref:tRNA threonylcarbamoyladenosine biosynthesis protein TsaE n=1 Tax=Gottschalkia purinilytica TaxID=1503 RepID=A0A0L0WDS0_GOTPU|nr:tRNA threonylcarbamoyladenosine biosynthesis protein TsaE [Gottschalkia purinilytica]